MSVAQVVNRYHACQGSLELLALEGRGALDLLESNPLAGFCLAINDQFRPEPVVGPMTAAWQMVYRPQREILAWLGFPGTEAMAKLGRKCVPASLTMRRCLHLRRALRQEAVRALLAHLPRINGGALDLIAQPAVQRPVTPQLLLEIATNPNEDGPATSAPVVQDMQRMARLLRRRQALAQVRTQRRLRELHDEMVEELNRQRRPARSTPDFPPPPRPGVTTPTGSIEPIRSRHALAELGRQQHNCVASYAEGVRRGRMYIYRVIHGREVCTLALERNVYDQWLIHDLKGVCNRPASGLALRFVQDWFLGRCRPGPVAPPAPLPAPPTLRQETFW